MMIRWCRLLMLRTTVCILLASACRDGPERDEAGAGGLGSSQMLLNGVGQGMTEAEVRHQLGAPASISVPFYAFMSEDSLVLWRYPGLRVEFVDQVVDRLICTGQSGRCATSDGIHIGDPLARVTATYGKAERLVRPLGGLLIYRQAQIPCTMTISLSRGAVSRIEVSCEEVN